MHIRDSFLQAEYRDGFYVRGMMKRYWAAGLELLSILDNLCKDNDIRYFVYYGTLLGAVRHKGFIPWDDDIDIVMLRWDYDRLIEAIHNLNDPNFNIVNVDASLMYPPRIVNTYYTCMDEGFLDRFHGCPYPVGIDIYVLDKVPTDSEEAEVLKWLHQNARFVSQRSDIRWKHSHPDADDSHTIESVISQLEQATGFEFIRDDTIVNQMTRFVHCISATYNDTDSPYVARIHNWSITGDDECLPIDWFEGHESLEFEHVSVPVPKNYREILEKTMGPNYMTPINASFGHNYPVYKKYEEKLLDIFKQCKQEPPAFLFE